MTTSGPSERRIVSVLFADLADSTAVAEQLDPEDWAEIASEALSAMSEAVAGFGGTVARLMGDGLLALFGAPTASEDDPERAVRAGVQMAGIGDRLRPVAARLGARLESDQLGVRVGIATGAVLAGEVGAPGSSEYTVLGDTANLAARLEKLAPAGRVLVAGETYRAVADLFDFEDVVLAVRGKDDPVECHLVRGPRTSRARVAPPVIGRTVERGALATACEAVTAGRGAVVGLLGEAGMGKSLLLDELAARAPMPVYRTSALSYEETSGFALVRRLVASLGGPEAITAALVDEPEARRSMLGAAMEVLSGGSAETTVEDVTGAMSGVVAGLATRHGSLMLILDDLHWADDASAEVVAGLFASTERLPLGVVWAARPVRRGPGWRLRQLADSEYPHRYTEVRLGPIEEDDTAELARSVLGVGADRSLVEAVVARAGGNPYFARELAGELAGGPTAVEDRLQRIPLSLQRLLLARFDRLSAVGRTALEVASVVGSTFSADIVAEVLGDDMAAALHELAREGIVEQEAGATHRFGHNLVRDAAYESIPKRRRRQLHAQVGDVLEAADAEPARLAFHFRQAGDPDRAAVHAIAAGERAVRVGAFADARRIYDEALDGLEDAHPARAALAAGRGRVRDLLGDTDGGLADLERALASVGGDSALAWRVMIHLGEAWAARDYRRTGDWYRQALDIARRDGTSDTVATSLNRLGNWYANASDPTTAVEMHTEALRLFRETGSDEGEAATHDLLGMASLIGGDERSALDHFAEAVRRFDTLGDVRGKVGASISSSIGAPNFEVLSEPPLLDVDTALRRLDEAREMAESIGWSAGTSFALFMRAQVRSCSGRLGDGIADAGEALRIARDIGHEQWQLASLLYLGAAEAAALDFRSARIHLEGSEALVQSVGSVNWALQVASVSGEVALRAGDPDRAAKILESALVLPAAERFASARSCRLVLALVRAEQGRSEEAIPLLGPAGDHAPFVALARGAALRSADPEAAMTALRTGIASAEHWGMTPLLWRLRHLAAEVTGDPGYRAAAEAAFCAVASSLDSTRAATMRAAGAAKYGLGCFDGDDRGEEDRHGMV